MVPHISPSQKPHGYSGTIVHNDSKLPVRNEAKPTRKRTYGAFNRVFAREIFAFIFVFTLFLGCSALTVVGDIRRFLSNVSSNHFNVRFMSRLTKAAKFL